MSEPRTIYLQPRCCVDPNEGRLWCEDDVWPCDDCPENACGVPYAIAAAARQGGGNLLAPGAAPQSGLSEREGIAQPTGKAQ